MQEGWFGSGGTCPHHTPDFWTWSLDTRRRQVLLGLCGDVLRLLNMLMESNAVGAIDLHEGDIVAAAPPEALILEAIEPNALRARRR